MSQKPIPEGHVSYLSDLLLYRNKMPTLVRSYDMFYLSY